jgi:formylglycine-generating enzyme required for sulfatase activity
MLAVLVAGHGKTAEKTQGNGPKSTPKVITNSVGMRLVPIPAGEFMIGSPESDDMAMSHEKPQHRVRITKPFYLGAYEVTQRQYQRVTGKNPRRSTGDPQRPVEMVSWNDAVEFCRRLGELPEEKAAGALYRLPTEAEWEYACRAGTTTRFCFGDQTEKLVDYAWYIHDWPMAAPGIPAATMRIADADAKKNEPHAVGQKKPNGWGLYDMHGNVWEWCSDWYAPYQTTSLADNPTGPDSGSTRVIRGGSIRDLFPAYLRCAFRTSNRPDYHDNSYGFRVVRTHPP